MTHTAESLSELGGTANHKISIRGQPFNHNNPINTKFYKLKKPDRVF
jgi:hypothetical protein